MQDRFLKLLVAQLNNQDPMNPMDNAQMTSQMAQMSTVTGIEQVNTTLKSMAEQFNTLQMLQGSNMVGHDVLVEGNSLTPIDGTAVGAIDLAGRAESVKVEVLSPGGQVIDTIDAGALDAGRNYFNWDASAYQGTGSPSFRVIATTGGKAIEATTLSCDKVVSVGIENGAMTVQLQSRGATSYDSIKAIL
ncbi:MAG: hypothetical protein JZU60_01320 [Ilumatobacteraceae bacterium]|nr:hypothetical protein [Ilumatobacteraceae bacterium]